MKPKEITLRTANSTSMEKASIAKDKSQNILAATMGNISISSNLNFFIGDIDQK